MFGMGFGSFLVLILLSFLVIISLSEIQFFLKKKVMLYVSRDGFWIVSCFNTDIGLVNKLK